jgi:hypothetical protein
MSGNIKGKFSDMRKRVETRTLCAETQNLAFFEHSNQNYDIQKKKNYE